MDTFHQICYAVIYAAKMKFGESIKDPEIKKAMRYTVQKMLYEQLTNQKYKIEL